MNLGTHWKASSSIFLDLTWLKGSDGKFAFAKKQDIIFGFFVTKYWILGDGT